MKIDSNRNVSDEIPTSSMADIAFLLIIYFMITTTFTATRGIDFAPPKDDDRPPEIEKEESVHIKIQPGGTLLVDTKPMEVSEILDYLEPKLKRNPKKPVIIEPDPAAAYADMVVIFDELRQGKERCEKDDTLTCVEVTNISIPTRREIESFWF